MELKAGRPRPCCRVLAAEAAVDHAGQQDRHRRQRAGAERDDEHLHHRVESLLRGLRSSAPCRRRRPRFRSRLRSRTGPARARSASPMNMPKPSADVHRERLAERPARARREAATWTSDHDQAAGEVDADLDRRELLGGAADRLDPADDHEPGQDGNRDHPRSSAARRPACSCTSAIEFVCVNGVVVSAATPATTRVGHASAGDSARRAGSTSGPTARRPAARFAERQAEHGFGELDRRREEAVAPDPEERARARPTAMPRRRRRCCPCRSSSPARS